MTLHFIGKGVYGCVVKPGITDSNTIDHDSNTISKIFHNEYDYFEELKNYYIIIQLIKNNHKYDGVINDELVDSSIHKYITKLLNTSTLNSDDINTLFSSDDILSNCNIRDNDTLFQIQYIYMAVLVF